MTNKTILKTYNNRTNESSLLRATTERLYSKNEVLELMGLAENRLLTPPKPPRDREINLGGMSRYKRY